MPEKKSETLEVRLPYSQKRAFMAACAADGTTASEEVRGFVGRFLDARAMKPGRTIVMTAKKNPLKAAASLLAVAGAGFALGTNGASVAADPDFERLDQDRDGALSAREIAPNAAALVAELDVDASGDVSEAELIAVGKTASLVTVGARGHSTKGKDPDTMRVSGVRIDYDLANAPVRVSVHRRGETVAIDAVETAMERMSAELYAIESKLGFGTVGPDSD